MSPRSLRHYEGLGLLSAERAANGYRDYPETAVDRAATAHSLFSMGFPRDLVGTALACTGDAPPESHVGLAERLAVVRDDLAAQIDRLTETHRAIVEFLEPPTAVAHTVTAHTAAGGAAITVRG